jgi:hypothetical protein
MQSMTSTSAPSPSIARLVRDLMDRAAGDPLVDELTQWLSTSPPFQAFATAYRPKIRKKVHSAAGHEALRDVRAELLAAHRLLVDKRFTVAYEAYGSGRIGPDLTVTYRTTTTFNVEVTRLRKLPDPAALGATLLVKLRQLPPSVPNVVLVASERPGSDIDIAGSVRALRTRADAKDDAFFDRAGLESGRGFYERFLRLSAIIAWCDEAEGDERATLWVNPSARIPLQARAGQASLACFRSGARGPGGE